MVEVKNLHKEIASFLKRDFDVEELHFEGEDDLDYEIKFQLKTDCDGTKIKLALREYFGDVLKFHTCEVGGILGVLLETD